MKKADVVTLASTYIEDTLAEIKRMVVIDSWYRGKNEKPTIPRGATTELKNLLELSSTPWLGLTVTTTSQTLSVDGYLSLDDTKPGNAAPWSIWQANAMDFRQVAINRAALAYGICYSTVLPGKDQLTGAAMAVIRGVSPLKMKAFYRDPAEDDWPEVVLRVEPNKGKLTVQLFDDTSIFTLQCEPDGSKMTYVTEEAHSVGLLPVVRHAPRLDLDGRAEGEVGPLIPLAARIDKTDFDRLMVQHFNSWKVKTVTGMSEPDTEEEANRAKLKLRQDDVLVGESPDMKFGTLDETDMSPFIAAHDSDVETLAAVAQIPSHNLTGKMVNLSAEALAAARSTLDAKSEELRLGLGRAYDQDLKLGAAIMGDSESARDASAHVTWQDKSIRSLSQAADALGKMAQQLGIPPEGLWQMVPGVTKTTVDIWKDMAEKRAKENPLLQVAASIQRQGQPVV